MNEKQLAEAKRILNDHTIPAVERLQRLHELDMEPDVARTVGLAIYENMLHETERLTDPRNPEHKLLTGDVPAVTGVHVRCDLTALLEVLQSMRGTRLPWRLESVMDGTILDTNAGTPTWTVRIITWASDRQIAESLGDMLLMRFILANPDIPTGQPFDRWHPTIN